MSLSIFKSLILKNDEINNEIKLLNKRQAILVTLPMHLIFNL